MNKLSAKKRFNPDKSDGISVDLQYEVTKRV